MQLDHLFICTPDVASAAAALRSFGLVEGSSNTHLGQGTANRRFFFHNAFIELLYLCDRAEAQNKTTRPTGLFKRLTDRDGLVSPFGIGFRPGPHQEDHAPFPGWCYQPAYLPSKRQIIIGDAPLMEPMWFFLSSALRPDQVQRPQREPLTQPRGWCEITSVIVTVPGIKHLSVPAQRAVQAQVIRVEAGSEHLIEIVLDGGVQAQSHDFNPVIPLLVHW